MRRHRTWRWGLIYCMVFGLVSAGRVFAFPSIKIDGERKVDFGEYPANESKEKTFSITNAGDEPLTIFKVRRTCGCLKMSGLKKTIEPGEKVEFRIEIPAYSLFGDFDKKVFLECDDPRSKHVTFSFKGKAVPILDIKPKHIVYVGRLPVGTAWQKTFKISPTRKGVEIEPPEIECNYPGKTSIQLGEDAAELQVSINIDEVKGDLKCKVRVPVRKPEGWEPAEVVISGKVGLCLAPAPSLVPLPTTSKKPVRKQFQLALLGARDGVSLDPNAIGIDKHDGLEFSFKKGKRANDCVVDVLVQPKFFEILRNKKMIMVTFTYPGAEPAKVKLGAADLAKPSVKRQPLTPLYLKPKPKPKPDIRRWRRR